MFRWLTKAFGDVGVVRFKAECADGTYTGTMEIESFNTGKTEIEAHIANALFVEKGIRVKSVNLIGFTEKG